jgi:anaerobic ribonucleoside-triphosphate reductase
VSVLKTIKNVISDYLARNSWRIHENSSFTYSLGSLDAQISGYETARYWLEEVYPPEISRAHKRGLFHIHDLGILGSYCNGWSLRQLITEGFGGLRNRVSSAPAKHLVPLVNQIVNFLGTLANESAGAQAFSSLDTFLAPFVREDDLNYKDVKQAMQILIFGLNVECRWSGQPPFSNVTLDWMVPSDMAKQSCIVGGIPLSYTYSDCQKEMDMINKAFIEVMIGGDAVGRLFSYPIPTYNITKDFNWDSENAKLLFTMAGKFGTPYFQNFINSDLKPDDVRSMCCRLQLSLSELRKRGGGLFGADEFTGSIGVVTVNMPQLMYRMKNKSKEVLLEDLDRIMDIAKDSLEIKRSVLNNLNGLNGGKDTLYPYTKRYLKKGLVNHFSTIGLVGMNEAVKMYTGGDLTTKGGVAQAKEILIHMREKLLKYQKETGNLYNLEATPAEGCCYKLARNDKKHYKNILCAGTEESPYYTNSSHLPVNSIDDIFEALELQEPLQTLYTGGTVLHGYLGEQIGWEMAMDIVKKAFTYFRLPYLSITPTFSVCEDHGYIAGEQGECPVCSKPTEIYSRVTGYYRSVERFNIGKKQEYRDRLTYNNGEDK